MTRQEQQILSQLQPRLAVAVAGILAHANAPGKLPPDTVLRAFCGYRTPAEQLAAFRAGNTKLKKSPHNYQPARACDLVFHVNGRPSWDHGLPWWLLIYWAEAAGLEAGGRWGTPARERKLAARPGMRLGWDCPHVQLRGWAARLFH